MLDVKMSQAQLAATSVTEMQVFLCTCVVRTLDYILALGQKTGTGLGPRNWSEKLHPKLTPLWRPTQYLAGLRLSRRCVVWPRNSRV